MYLSTHFDKCGHLNKESHSHKIEHEVVKKKKKELGIHIFLGNVLKYGNPHRAGLKDMKAVDGVRVKKLESQKHYRNSMLPLPLSLDEMD